MFDINKDIQYDKFIELYILQDDNFCDIDNTEEVYESCEKIIAFIYEDYEKVYNLLKKFEEKIDLNEKLNMIMGVCCMKLDKKKESLIHLYKVTILNPFNGEAYALQGHIFFEFRKYCSAIELYSKAIKLFEEGLLLINNNENSTYQYKEQIFKSLYVCCYLNRGKCYSKIGKHKNAIADYNKVVQIDYKNLLAYECKGLLILKSGKYSDAIKEFENIIKIDKNHYNSYIKIAECYKNMSNYDEALKYLNTAISINSETLEAYRIRSICFYNIKRYEDSIGDLKLCIESKTFNNEEVSVLFKHMAYCYKQMGKINEALESYEKAISFNSNNINLKEEYEQLQKEASVFSKIVGVFTKKK